MMKVFFLQMLTNLLLLMKTGESLTLDNNQFLIYNKVYHNARLAQWGKGKRDVGTYGFTLYPDQLWTLEPHPTQEGCYYIVNEVHSQHRIANSKHKFIVYSGPHYDDQLFKFVPSGDNDGFYYIYSCFYTNDRITKYGIKDRQLSMYDGPMHQDQQLWRLVPRFKATFFTDEIYHYDNRLESEPVTIEVPVTSGIQKSSTSKVLNKTTFKQSIAASFNEAIKIFDFGATVATEFSSKLKTLLYEANEENWSETNNMTLSIAPGKNVKVMQHVVFFEGALASDSCSLLTSVKVFESETENFDDPDGFNITEKEECHNRVQ